MSQSSTCISVICPTRDKRIHLQSCQQPPPQKQRPKRVPCAETAKFSHLRIAEEFNCVTQAEVTPQDWYLRAEPAQLQLF